MGLHNKNSGDRTKMRSPLSIFSEDQCLPLEPQG